MLVASRKWEIEDRDRVRVRERVEKDIRGVFPTGLKKHTEGKKICKYTFIC